MYDYTSLRIPLLCWIWAHIFHHVFAIPAPFRGRLEADGNDARDGHQDVSGETRIMGQFVPGTAPDIKKSWRNHVSVEMSDRRLPVRMRIRRIRSLLHMLASDRLLKQHST
jgi:hypothetical protein